MENTEEFAKYLPTSPPEGVIPWLREKERQEYAVYRCDYVKNPASGRCEEAVRCVCTACGGTFFRPKARREDWTERTACHAAYCVGVHIGFTDDAGRVIVSGNKTVCPLCGAEVEAKHTSKISRYGNDVERIGVMTVHAIGGRLCLMTWYVLRSLYRDGTTELAVHPYEAYVVCDRKILRLTAYEKYYTSLTFLGEWKQRKRFSDTWGKTVREAIFPWRADILEQTSAANCKLDKYIKASEVTYPVTYMALWVKHRNVENLVMQGMGALVSEMISAADSYYTPCAPSVSAIANANQINWKEAKPHKMLGISKEAFRTAKKEKWGRDSVKFYKEFAGRGVRPEDVKLCEKYSFYKINKLSGESGDIMRELRYLEKQRNKYPKSGADVDMLLDYWDMARKLGEDMRDRSARYPQKLRAAHDSAVKSVKWKEDAELMEKFKERYEILSKFSYEADGLFIRPARSQRELIEEGETLHHCVGNYAKRHAEGKTDIFFIRSSENPEEPYFTLELDEAAVTVLQNRGMRNCSRTEDVKEFEEKWLKYARAVSGEENNARQRVKCAGA